MADATFARNADDVRIASAAAASAGELRQCADGRARWLNQLTALAAGDTGRFRDTGQVVCPKVASKVCLDGGPAYWDHANNYITPLKPLSGRGFFAGTFVGDAAAADTTCTVNLNVQPVYEIELTKGAWTAEATNGLGVTLLVGGGAQLAFDAVAEAAQAAIYSERTLPIASNAILAARWAIFDKGDNAALDFDIGLASGSHATDFEAITEFVSVHFDGNALDLKVQSDDGTTDVAVTDSTVDAVDDTFVEVWIDTRNPADVQVYIDAVLVLGATVFRLDNATGPLRAIALMEKTSDDTLADVRIAEFNVRIAEQ